MNSQSVAVIFKFGQYVLMSKRIDPERDFCGYLAVPGGGIEEGESEISAVLREVREEVGEKPLESIKASNTTRVGMIDDTSTMCAIYCVELDDDKSFSYDLPLFENLEVHKHTDWQFYHIDEVRGEKLIPGFAAPLVKAMTGEEVADEQVEQMERL